MKYSTSFERDYNWYLKYKDIFIFSGNNKHETVVLAGNSELDKSAKECFYSYDCSGKMFTTYEPELLKSLLLCKGSINFNIKMWTEDRVKGYLPYSEFENIIKEYELLPWMIEAVENQRVKYY